MNHATILLIKFVTCLIAFGIGLDLFFDATIVDIVSFSLFVTIVSYAVGELVILPQLGKRAAAVADFLLTYLSVWVFGSFLFESYLQVAWGSIISAVIITGAEVFVHLFVAERQNTPSLSRSRGPASNSRLAFGTEMAEEENLKDLSNTLKRNEDNKK
ncbi:YndM family protein [Metabacillus sp. YM-086]|uniref:YndM family protein n=1 Tax=Metabacillus sp. YM-086 TaxID=3341729 RepID=UPI003A8B10A7